MMTPEKLIVSGYTRPAALNGIDSVRKNAPPANIKDLTSAESENVPPPTKVSPPAQTKKGKFELFKDKAGEFRWRLRHQNGNIVADSGEGYTTKTAALNGIESVRKNAPTADIKEPEVAEPETAPLAVAAPIVTPPPEVEVKAAAATPPLEIKTGKFELFKDKAGEFRWRLRHQNGNIVADSGEGYTTKTAALDGIESVRKNAPTADIKEVEVVVPQAAAPIITPPPKVELQAAVPPVEVKAPEVKRREIKAPEVKAIKVKAPEVTATSAGIRAESKAPELGDRVHKRPAPMGSAGTSSNTTTTIAIIAAIIFFVICAGVLLSITNL